MVIKKEKQEALEKAMEELGICEKDLTQKFILGTGKGGQKINKKNTSVYLKHLPSGIEVKSHSTRSREDNRFFARRKLIEKFKEKFVKGTSKRLKRIEKIKKQKNRRKRRQKSDS